MQRRILYSTRIGVWLYLVTLWFLSSVTIAQELDERFSDWPLRTTIRGSVVLAASLADLQQVPESVRREMGADVDVAGKPDEEFDKGLSELGYTPNGRAETGLQRGGSVARPLVINYESLGKSPEAVEWLSEITEAQLAARGVVISIGPHQAGQKAQTHPLPDCVIQTNFKVASDNTAFVKEIGTRSRAVGVGIPTDSTLILSGRNMMCFGETIHFVIASEKREESIQETLSQRVGRANIKSWLVDLTQLRRRAIDLELEPFPPAKPKTPHVTSGTLLIVGGGGTPKGLMQEFVRLAGGKDARLVYVPCSEQEEVSDRQGTVRGWDAMGVASALTLHTKDRTRANTDEAFYAPLKTATGIWFGGGRQWNFSDSYYGTATHRLMKDVLKRGGVIGGSSAGASIQARYLARATPIGNFDIMAPGYERGGLGFLSGVAIDQHFSQRGRRPDMKELVAQHPQMLGIGIDETTAIKVQGSTATVQGSGQVFFFDKSRVTELSKGEVYDLERRTKIAKE